MANFFSGLWEAAKNPLQDAKLFGKVLTGKTSLKDLPGEHQEQMNAVTVPILGDNKLSKNSDAVAGAIVGGIFAAPLLAGGTASTSGGAAGMGGVGGMGTTGATTSSGFGGLGGMSGWSATGGTTSSGLGGVGGMSGGAGGAGSLSAYFTPTASTASAVSTTSTEAAKGVDWLKMANAMKNVQSTSANQTPTAQVNLRGTGGGGASFNSNRFKNAALEKEYQSIYTSPTYKKLV